MNEECLRGGKLGGAKWVLLLFGFILISFSFGGGACKGEGRTLEDLENEGNWGA